MLQIDVWARAEADPQHVWGLLTDVDSWATWAPFDEIAVEEGHEVGEVRRVRSGRVTTRERVVAFEPPHRYVYQIVSGLPVRDYIAEVLLVPASGGGTEVQWRAKFRASVPGTGWVLKYLLRRAITKAADALVARADAVS